MYRAIGSIFRPVQPKEPILKISMSYLILFHYTTQQETFEKIGEAWRVVDAKVRQLISHCMCVIAIELCKIFYCACANPRLMEKKTV